jgi:glycosidase
MKRYLLFFLLLNIFTLEAQESDSVSAVPQWVNKAVFYQIYPQTYFDSNADGIGDLPGITNKLDYVQGLGVSAIWISPFYASPFRDAGYDVSDYYSVAPRYGTLEDARTLIEQAHARNLKVLLDFVPGHTSIDHEWFKRSCREEGPYANWYIWTNDTFEDVGDLNGKMISGYCERNGKYMTNFFWSQPALNYGFAEPDKRYSWQLPTDHPDILLLKKEMLNVMKFWMDIGADGFRVDMAGSLVKNDVNGSCAAYWRQVRNELAKINPEVFLISEWSDPVAAVNGGFHADFFHWFKGYDDLFQREKNRNLYAPGGHSFFDKAGRGDISGFLTAYLHQYEQIKGKGFISLPVGNHDLIRINNNGRTQRDLELIYVFQFTIPNIPFVYYGDEIGMRQLDNLPADEGCYGIRAGARTPMQWSREKNAGFSTADEKQLYRTYDHDANAATVSESEKNPSSLLFKTRKLIALRKEESALLPFAGFKVLYAEKGKYPFIFERTYGEERLIVVLNPAGYAAEATVETVVSPKPKLLLSGGNIRIAAKKGVTTFQCEGQSYAVYKTSAQTLRR